MFIDRRQFRYQLRSDERKSDGTLGAHAHSARPNGEGKIRVHGFPIDKPLPTALVKKLVKERILENEARMSEKQKKR